LFEVFNGFTKEYSKRAEDMGAELIIGTLYDD
jgi:hypothetical protein